MTEIFESWKEKAKDDNENIKDLSRDDRIHLIENEVETLLQLCIKKGLTDKQLQMCVNSFTGDTYSPAVKFYKTNSKFFFSLAILALVSAIAFEWEPVYNRVCVHTRLLSMKVLPFWDWSALFNEECLVDNPYVKGKNFTEDDCMACKILSKEGVEKLRNAKPDVIAQDFLFSSVPVIVQDATRDWNNIDQFTVPALQQLYQTHKDLKDLSTCTFLSNFEDTKTIYEFWNEYNSGELKEGGWFMFVENCNLDASKVIRRLYKRPYFLPQSVEMSRFNQIYIAKGKGDIKSEEEEQPLINQEDTSGSWIVVVSGKLNVLLYPIEDCSKFSCKNFTISVSQGEALVVPHQVYFFKFAPASENYTIAVSGSMTWDEQ